MVINYLSLKEKDQLIPVNQKHNNRNERKTVNDRHCGLRGVWLLLVQRFKFKILIGTLNGFPLFSLPFIISLTEFIPDTFINPPCPMGVLLCYARNRQVAEGRWRRVYLIIWAITGWHREEKASLLFWYSLCFMFLWEASLHFFYSFELKLLLKRYQGSRSLRACK